MNEKDLQDELSEDEKYNKVPQHVVLFLITFFSKIIDKVQRIEGKRLIELALVNLKYHPLLPTIGCIIEFRNDNVSYSVIYTNYKIELSNYISVDTGFGWDHYQSFKMYYTPTGNIVEEGDFDDFDYNINFVFNAIPVIEPTEEE